MDSSKSAKLKNTGQREFQLTNIASTTTVSCPSESGELYLLSLILPKTSNNLLACNVKLKSPALIEEKCFT